MTRAMIGPGRKPGRKPLGRDDLVERLQVARRAKGRPPTSRDADQLRYGLPSVAAYVREFGSWRLALSEAGYKASGSGGKR